MAQILKIKLSHVLHNNPLMPIIVASTKEIEFENKIVLSVFIEEKDLYTLSFAKSLNLLDGNNKFLVIDGLDQLLPEKQLKFLTLLKDRRLGGLKLPETMHLVVLVKNLTDVNKKLIDFCLVLKEG